jgi:hypothetical protein
VHLHHISGDARVEVHTSPNDHIAGHIVRWINIGPVTLFFDDEYSRRKFMGKIADKFNTYLDDCDAEQQIHNDGLSDVFEVDVSPRD